MGGAYPELREHAESIDMWLSAEEEGFGRTLAQGMATLRELIERARESGSATVPADDVFRLHDTFGFPFEMTSELLAEEGLAIEGDFEALMEEQRARGRVVARGAAVSTGGGSISVQGEAIASSASCSRKPARDALHRLRDRPSSRRRSAPSGTSPRAGLADGGGHRFLVKLAESPFYAAGGGQVADVGTIECADGDCRARVDDVVRVGDDQA